MAEGAHTPAPWFVVKTADLRTDGYIREVEPTEDGRRVAVAQITKSGRSREEYEANANIIAAAPEMLDALRLAYAVLPCGSELAAVTAAIEKAEGAS